jgi:hypothetical protein
VAEDFTDPFYTLGRIHGVLEMLDKPDIYRLAPEQCLQRIREIMTQYKLNREVDKLNRAVNRG